MENSKKIQFGLLGVVAALLVANLFGGGFKNWFGQSEGEKIRDAASASVAAPSSGTAPAPITSSTVSSNIPGTNVTTPEVPTGPTTNIKYEQESFDFGVIDEGDVVKHTFKFKNDGHEPLVITNAKGSCGCTVPTWQKDPIPPGATGEIKVEFNSKGKPGNQNKRVTVTANTNPTETFLEIKGTVRSKDAPVSKGATN